MLNLLLIPLGATLLTVGLISYPTPLPGSTIVTASGLAILIVSSELFRGFVRSGRGRWIRLDRGLDWLERHSTRRIASALAQTRPDSLPLAASEPDESLNG